MDDENPKVFSSTNNYLDGVTKKCERKFYDSATPNVNNGPKTLLIVAGERFYDKGFAITKVCNRW